MNNTKEEFLRKEFIPLMRKLSPEMKGKWGVMTPQEMVEHFSETMRYANNRIKLPLHTPEEKLPAFRTFMLSEKPFRENTKNPMMGDTPKPNKNASLEEAIVELENELTEFFRVFENEPQLITTNPIFGQLSFEENIHLLHKHAVHHLKQFGILE